MRTNLYKSNGHTFADETIINDIDELADYVNDRYSLDSEAEVVDGSFSVLVFTWNAHNILFESFTQGDETVCGCPALNDYVTANEEWAEDIIENASLTKEDIRMDKGSAIIYAVSDAVADEMDSELCLKHECDIVAMETDIDHITRDNIGTVAEVLSYFASTLLEKHIFWSDGYFACSVGDISTETARHYIENQG